MANDLTVLIPKLLAQGLMALRGATVMPRLVNRGYENLAGEKGSSITIPIPSAVTVQDVTPANIPPTTGDIVPTSATIVLDQWKEAPFYLTDKDQLEAMNGTIPMQASEAIKSIATTVNAYLLSMYKGIYGFSGTSGTTPFVTDLTEATMGRKVLNKQLAPMTDRRGVIDPDAEANALLLRAFQDQSWRGDNKGFVEGVLARALGFDWYMDQQVPYHTAGTITTGLAAKAATAQAVGLKSVVCTTAASTGACALKKGDIITFAGDTQTYVVTADTTQATASADVTVPIYPGLVVAKAGNEAVTVKSSHTVNMLFHRDAFAFATRPLADANAQGLGSIISSAVDPVSGLSLRLEVTREHKRTRFSYDMLYGGALVRPELAVRMAG